jgi:disulfide bond formation protein DsbB
MSRKNLILAALAGSAGLLLGALAFQYLAGLPPCKLCIWQRWPHVVAFVGVLGLAIPGRIFPWIGAAGAATSGGIGIYHTGVEQRWWEGPTSCTGLIDFSALTPQELLDQVLAAPVVRCDEIAWQMLGLSMASWNAIFSFIIAGIWLLAASKRR